MDSIIFLWKLFWLLFCGHLLRSLEIWCMSRRRKFGVIMFLGWDRCFFSFLYEKGLEILFLLSENIIKLSVYFQSFPKIHYCFSLRNVYLRPCIIFDRRFQSFFYQVTSFFFSFRRQDNLYNVEDTIIGKIFMGQFVTVLLSVQCLLYFPLAQWTIVTERAQKYILLL